MTLSFNLQPPRDLRRWDLEGSEDFGHVQHFVQRRLMQKGIAYEGVSSSLEISIKLILASDTAQQPIDKNLLKGCFFQRKYTQRCLSNRRSHTRWVGIDGVSRIQFRVFELPGDLLHMFQLP
jgi:hypothetical protein